MHNAPHPAATGLKTGRIWAWTKLGTGTQARLRSVLQFFLLAAVFSISYTQSPLFTSNQNQYFLHGLARAGLGFLHEDWLANTLDPTPVFSAIVAFTAGILHSTALFYVYYALLMGVYLACLLGIAGLLFDLGAWPRKLAFVALLVLVHSAGLRFALSRALGANWTYVLEDGVADQRLLGPVFQPSAFGVLLLLSIYLFLREQPYLAVLSAAAAATVHPTYLLSAAVLTGAYLLLSWQEQRDVRRVALTAALALAAVAPIVLYVYGNFGDTPPATTAQARNLLVNFRIPHHALISWWMDATVAVKITLVAVALLLIRRSRLFFILLLVFLAIVNLTLLQVLLESDFLALLFPWRMSTFLVPLSTALVLAGLVSWVSGRYEARPHFHPVIVGGGLLVIALCIAVGIVRLKLDFERKAASSERPVLEHIANHHAPGEVYLIPVKMQDFRLEAGSPAYVEFKSIPYVDTDVLEWYRRIQLADRFYNDKDCSALASLAAEEGVTHAVLPVEPDAPTCPSGSEVYRNQAYRVLSLRP